MRFSDYLVFVDESGDHSLVSIDPQYPVFVLCFCIVHKQVYCQEITPRLRELKIEAFGHDLVVLHEHEIRKRRGPFRSLGPEAREALLDRLTQVIADADITLIAVVIDKPKHAAKYANPYHPYYLSLQFGLERIYSFMRQHGQDERVTHVICEARGAKEDAELELQFRRVRDGAYLSRCALPFELVIAHKRTNSEGLQLADLTARPIGLSVLRPKQKNRAYEIIKSKLYSGLHSCIIGNGLKVFP